jgi:hypothetical protein
MDKKETAENLLGQVRDEHLSYLIGVGNNWIVNEHPPKKSEYKYYMSRMLRIMKKIEGLKKRGVT